MPLLVRGGEIDGAAGRRRAVPEVLRAVAIDQARARREIAAIEQLRRCHSHRRRVAHVAIDIGEGELHRLDLQMLRRDRVDRLRAEIEILEDAERHQRRDALAVGRNLVDRIAVVIVRQRRYPVAAMRIEIGERVGAPVRARMRDHRFGQLAAIERLAAAGRDFLQRSRHRGGGEDLAGLRRPAARQEVLGETSTCAEYRHGLGPLLGDDRRNGIAFAGVTDRRREQVGERQLAEPARQRDPARHRAGNRDRVPTGARHRLETRETRRRPRLRARVPRR